MNDFSIIIPVFNEDKNLNSLIKEIIISLKNYKDNFEIILIDDGSTDETISTINSLIDKYPLLLKLISNKKNLGQSFSIIKGIQESSFDVIVTIDGDGQNNPQDIKLLLDHFFSNQDIFLVGGIRKNRKDNLLKIISSIIANYIRNLFLNDNCKDTGCSLKVFDKNLFMKFPFFNGIHRFLPALFSSYGKKTLFINVDHRPRIHGYSKYDTLGRLIRGIRDLIKVIKIIKKIKRDNA